METLINGPLTHPPLASIMRHLPSGVAEHASILRVGQVSPHLLWRQRVLLHEPNHLLLVDVQSRPGLVGLPDRCHVHDPTSDRAHVGEDLLVAGKLFGDALHAEPVDSCLRVEGVALNPVSSTTLFFMSRWIRLTSEPKSSSPPPSSCRTNSP